MKYKSAGNPLTIFNNNLYILPLLHSYNNSQQPLPLAAVSVVPKNDKHAILQSIASSYRRNDVATYNSNNNSNNNNTAKDSTVATSPRRRGSLASKRRRDCRVSHWSEWTQCSKSCGIGEMHRYRKVIKHGKRGGRPCPPLQQSKWCGSERNCHGPQSYFNW